MGLFSSLMAVLIDDDGVKETWTDGEDDGIIVITDNEDTFDKISGKDSKE